MFLAAAAYGITVYKWAFTYGFCAAGIGIVVGLSMRFLGRGFSTRFAVAAAALTIAGCLLGRFFRVVIQVAVNRSITPLEVLRQDSFQDLAERAAAYFSLIDLVYWFVAVFFAAFLAIRPLTRSDRLAVGIYKKNH